MDASRRRYVRVTYDSRLAFAMCKSLWSWKDELQASDWQQADDDGYIWQRRWIRIVSGVQRKPITGERTAGEGRSPRLEGSEASPSNRHRRQLPQQPPHCRRNPSREVRSTGIQQYCRLIIDSITYDVTLSGCINVNTFNLSGAQCQYRAAVCRYARLADNR